MHDLCFKVELVAQETPFRFRDGFLLVEVKRNDSPMLEFVSDEDGFLVWKHPELEPTAQGVYETLKGVHEFTDGTFDFVKGAFTFVFFNQRTRTLCFGKDRLGLSSLLFSEEPLVVGSHDIDGEEHPPGLTVLTESTKVSVPLPKFSRAALQDEVAVEAAIDNLTKLLCQGVRVDVPVLFSGGLDSTLIAGCLGLVGAKKVDLINFCVAENAPDRLSARESLADLTRSFPGTNFVLHEFTGDIDEMSSKLLEIRGLVKPAAVTEMNLNIAMTLFSALSHVDHFLAHSGLGADELFCGYMRMKAEGTAEAEVTEHINRLWVRNGGRDDRVAMHLGKQCVCPFLSSEFITYSLSLPMSLLIRPEMPRGHGEKWILRQVAAKLGLKAASERPKQAMQFGSKVAKAKWRGSEAMPKS